MRLGFIGLGKMGSRMVMKLLEEGHEIVVWNRSEAPVNRLKFEIRNSKFEMVRQAHHLFESLRAPQSLERPEHSRRTNSNGQKLKISKTIEELVKSLEKPRVVWVMVTAGEATQNILDEVSKFTEQGDIIIDGGNSYYKDTELRYKTLRAKNIKFLGIGVSGGIIAEKTGYPLMVGGDRSAYDYIKPVLDSLTKPNGGHEYFGDGGAGHFVKMVHNGIEYGIMQSLGEGFGVLDKSPYKLDLLKIAKIWQKGTLVSGFMLDRAVDVLSKDPKLSQIVGSIQESGEAQWTIEQAKEEGVPIEIIEKSLEFRKRSQKDAVIQNSFAAKLIASLRSAFGGHQIKKGQK